MATAPAPAEEQEAPSANAPLLLALQEALEDHESAATERILERLSERELDAKEEALVKGFERIVRGRGLVRGLSLELVLGDQEGERRLYLRVHNRGAEDLVMRFPPLSLDSASLVLTAQGEIHRNLSSQVVHPLAEQPLGAGATLEVFLGECPAVLPAGSLAVRDAWRVTIRSGHLMLGEHSYPAERLPRPELSQDTLAQSVQGEPQAPHEFAAFMGAVLRDGGAGNRELLERALRLDPEQREALLPLLMEVLGEYANPLLDRSGALAAAVLPSLRWISPSANVESNLAAWSKWTREWTQRRAQSELAKNRSGLVLPRQ